MPNLAIIPARGGSKRIPRKNIRDFLGKPIIAYAIEAARESGLFEEIMVSTDDHEIAAVARSFGAEVPFLRSNQSSSDTAILSEALKEVIDEYGNRGRHFDYFCCLLPTATLVTPALIRRGYKMISSGDYSSVRPVIPFTYPIQRAVTLDKDGYMAFLSPENYHVRSQDLVTTYHDSATVYWVKRGYNISDQYKKGAFEIEPIFSQDIDTPEDWEIAEFKFEYLRKKNLIF